MLNEANIIARFKADFPDYIGDDAAVITALGEQNYVITKDLLIEDIHFRRSYFEPSSLAHKALHVNLSDLAAMGAKPKFILCGISIPMSHQKYVEEFLHHFAVQCKKENVILIGGDTTKSPDKLFISITAIGIASKENIKYRHTAKSDDLICVAGNLGEAHLGLIACEKSLADFESYKNAFLRPNAKIREGIWLGSKPFITSMMDISDGLFIDLKRLCASSKVQGNIELETLKPSPKFLSACHSMKLDPLDTMLTGGEDYSLLFTVDAAMFAKLSKSFTQKFDYAIKHIGYVSSGSGIHFTAKGKHKNLKLQPFSHFGEL